SPAWPADLHALHAHQRRVELAQHKREILTVGLTRIARSHRLPFPARIELAREFGTEALRDRECALGDRQRLRQSFDALAIVAERGERILTQGPLGDRGGDR